MTAEQMPDLLCLHCRHAYNFHSSLWPHNEGALAFSCDIFDDRMKEFETGRLRSGMRYIRTRCLNYEEEEK